VIYITDGESRMLSGWTLSAKSVEPQQDGADAVKAASENAVASGVGH
jgi:hypothetical protein